MRIYLILLLLITMLGLILQPDYSCIRKKIFLKIIFFLLVIISSIREYTVGVDTLTYVNLFLNIDNVNLFNSRYEPGFVLYLKTLSLFSEDPRIMIIVSSTICIGMVCYMIYHYSNNTLISVLLYILMGSYFSQMNLMRQFLAISIIMLGFSFLLKDKKRIAAILLLLSCSFHLVSVVSFIPYIVWVLGKEKIFLKMSFKSIFVLVIGISVFLFLIYPQVMQIVAVIFPQYYGYFNGTWGDANYFASLLETVVLLSFFIIGIIFQKHKKISEIQKFVCILLGLSIIFAVLSMRMEIWSRVLAMFKIYTMIIWTPNFINLIKDNRNRVITVVTILLCATLYMLVILFFRPEWTGVVPYKVGIF